MRFSQAIGFFAAFFVAFLSNVASSAKEVRGKAQQTQFESGSELLANLAAGRVEVLVCRDGIVVATAESYVEPDTLPPMIVPLSAFRVGVFLGPVEWTWPGSSRARSNSTSAPNRRRSCCGPRRTPTGRRRRKKR